MIARQIILVAVIFALAVSLGLFSKNKTEMSRQDLKIGGVILNVEVARTNAERTQGLSGRSGLGENEGMLFVFGKEDYLAFWMKDMNFPIDMAWLDKDKKIIHIENALSPDTYKKYPSQVFRPDSPALYVLETSAHFFENHQIEIGQVAEF